LFWAAERLEQTTILMQDCAIRPNTACVDRGYRGVEDQNAGIEINHHGKRRRLDEITLEKLKRRQSIEPVIGT
jgi:IS5 family transposase